MTSKSIPTSPCPTPFSDHVFKREHGVEVPLRVWPALGVTRPWLLWLHGGGMYAGKHLIPNAWVIPACREYGFHCVSVGYRLVPHVSSDDCLQDCQDALTWCRQNLSRILGANAVDIDACAVGGDSAGGLLTSQAGIFFDPLPKVCVIVFGLNDLLERHHKPPAPAHAEKPVYLKDWGEGFERRFQEFLDQRDPSKAEIDAPWDWELEPNMDVSTLRSFWGAPDFTPSERDYLRMDVLKWSHYHSQFWDMVNHREAFASDQEYVAHLRNRSAFWRIDDEKCYPPTFFVHGIKDRSVPIEQSYNFARKLRGFNVPVGEAYDPEGGHSFDNDIEGPHCKGWQEYIVPCMDFVSTHVRDT